MTTRRLALIRDATGTRSGGSAHAGARTPPLPNASGLSAPSDDPAARRRELLVVLALCRARTAGAREWALPDRGLTLMRDE
jgi:hypothetical protein